MDRRVVVTGLGALSPVGNTAKETWASLVAGKNGIGPISRFDASEFKVKIAAEVKNFDPLLTMEKSEVRKYDPFIQYIVAAASECLEDAGLPGDVDPRRFGVYIGSGIGGIQTTTRESDKLAAGAKRVSPFLIPMMIVNMAAGVVAIRAGAMGPSLPVVTACATSSHAVGEAFRAIKHGYADVILAGGGEAGVCPIAVAGFIACQALSPNPDPATACRPFDKDRDGFVIGEGGVVLALEELSHARARGAHIYGEVAGYGNTCDAYHYTAPQPEAQGTAEAIRLAVAEGGVTPGENTYVNLHGTSTELNDAAETLAYKKALGDAAYKVTASSTKSMTGHMLGAAGALEAMVCLKAMEEGVAPPTIGLREAGPECDLDYTPRAAAKKPFDTAISTSLGFGGHNAALVFKKV